MKAKVLVIAFLVALFVGLGVAYASNNNGPGKPQGGDTTTTTITDNSSIPVSIGDTMVIVVGPSVGQYNCFSVTQSQAATQTATGTSTQTASSEDSPAGNLSLVGNVALGLQANLQAGTNNNISDMYTETAVGSFNRISRVKGGRGR